MSTHDPASKPAVRLLLVEDYAPLALATAEFLRAEGLDVRIAQSGEEALNEASSFYPQIVLCDLSLPDISGLDVARALRANARTMDVLFALHTAAEEGNVRELELGFVPQVDLVVPKPITTEKVKTLLAALKPPRRRT